MLGWMYFTFIFFSRLQISSALSKNAVPQLVCVIPTFSVTALKAKGCQAAIHSCGLYYKCLSGKI